MLSVSNLSKTYAGRVLFANVSFHITGGECIGLVGPNGAGKTTLFSLILGETTPDDGQVMWQKGSTVGYLPQESAPVGDETILSLALSHTSEAGRWENEPKAKRILRGLAFRESDFDRPARTLSGGWVMRAHLARLLVQEPDLLLLDEPTNHLDLESLIWFQNYLKSYPGAILMISHDREFLNQLVGHILEIAYSEIARYRGNYDDYVRERAAREEQMQSAFDNQQREIAKLQTWVDRFKAKANFASRAQDKMKMIDRIERVEAPRGSEKTVKFVFPQPKRSGQKVVMLKDVDFSYPTEGGEPNRIYTGLEHMVERGERIVLVGPNGAGKSTMLKLLAGVLTPERGTRELGANVNCGYFSQNRVDTLNLKHTVLESAMDQRDRVGENLARTLLGSFLFRGDDVFKPVGVLSGGEKSRLALVRLLLAPPNLLLMDEPTTHLDMGSIDALIGALEPFEGTLVFISHDVHFIRQMARTVLHIDAGRVTPYAGDYQYFLDKTKAGSAREALTAKLGDHQPRGFENASKQNSGPKGKEQRRIEAEQRNARSRAKRELEQKVTDLEAQVSASEKRRDVIHSLLQDPATFADGARANDLHRELDDLEKKIVKLTAEWEAEGARVESAKEIAGV